MEKEQDLLFNVADIVKRAKRVLNFKTDAELAAYLGVSRPTLSNWIARNGIDFPLLLEKLKEIDYNWLLVGKGQPVHQAKFCNDEIVSGEVEMIHNPKTADPVDDRSVPLYDITAAANLKHCLPTNSNTWWERYRFRTYLSATEHSTSVETACIPS